MISRFFDNRWGPLVAFLFIVLAVVYVQNSSTNASDQRLYESQIAGCHRGNGLRQESNDRITAHKADTRGLIEFLRVARVARLSAYDRDHNRSDLVAAQKYTNIANQVGSQANFSYTPLVDCAKTIEKP